MQFADKRLVIVRFNLPQDLLEHFLTAVYIIILVVEQIPEGTVSFTSGKYYWEATAITGTTNGSVGGRFSFCVQADETSQINPEYIDNIAWHSTAGMSAFFPRSATRV